MSIKLPQKPHLKLTLPDLKNVTMPSIHDIPGLDALRRLPSMFSVDLTDLDIRRVADSQVAHVAKRAASDIKDAAFTAVGFGVLAVQKAQVRRREFFDARRDNGANTVTADSPTSSSTATPVSPDSASA